MEGRLPRRPLSGLAANVVAHRGLCPSQEELEAARCILNTALLEGNTYPFDEEMDKDTFKAYFLSHDAFVLKHAGTQQV